jgi:hypothetical protein
MKLKKGSKEAKAYMAKIRAKRGKVGASVGALPFTGSFDGVKFRADHGPDGIIFTVGSKKVNFKRGNSATEIGEKIANAIKADNGVKYTDTEYRSLKSKFTRFAGTLKTELPKKATTKKATIKKAAPVKAPTVKKVQRGGSSLKLDLMRKAKAPGKRKSSSGATYYESRRNRSDVPGTMAGIGAIQSDINRKFLAAQKHLSALVGQLAQTIELGKQTRSKTYKAQAVVIRKKIKEARKLVALLKRAAK